MKNLLFYLCIISLLVSACKKKETSSANSTSVNSATTGSNPINAAPNGTGTTNYDILFEMVQSSAKYNSTYTPFAHNCRALFCAQTVTNEVQTNLIDMGTVSLNGTVFANHLSNISFYYTDSTYSTFSSPFIWNVAGSSALGNASFTTTAAFPTYSNYSILPDSISKAAGITISFTGLGGCDFVQVFINGPSGSAYLSPKLVAGDASGVTFTSSELSGMNTGSGYFTIKFLKDNILTFNGKKVNMRTGTSYSLLGFKIKP